MERILMFTYSNQCLLQCQNRVAVESWGVLEEGILVLDIEGVLTEGLTVKILEEKDSLTEEVDPKVEAHFPEVIQEVEAYCQEVVHGAQFLGASQEALVQLIMAHISRCMAALSVLS